MTTAPPDHEKVTVSFTPEAVLRRQATPNVEWVDVDGEIVVWNAANESLHLLDRIASLIFHLLDGETPLEVTGIELASVFEREADDVLSDVIACAESLAAMGLVERAA